MCETPDSTLDSIHEGYAANTFKSYINSNNTLILSANARQSKLISILYNSCINDDNVNVIDLTKISKYSIDKNGKSTTSFEDYLRGANHE